MSDQISELTKRLKKTIKEIDWMGRKIHPKLRKKATEENLESLKEKLGRDIPAQYRDFVTQANGMEGADILEWTIQGTSDATKGETFKAIRAEYIEVLRSYDAEDPVIGLLEGTHVIASDFHTEVVIFDPSVKKGEPPLLRISGSGDHQPPFENFQALLEHVVGHYEDQLSMFEDPDIGFGGGGGGGGGLSGGSEEEQLLKELASLLDGNAGFTPEPEPEPEPQVSPEMALAVRMCEHVIDKLVEADLVDLVEAPGCRENLEDYLMRKLMRSTREDQVLDNWIHALGKAREVEELYGTDEELKRVMQKAWDDVAEEQEQELEQQEGS